MWQFISCLCIYLYAYNMDTSSPYSYKYIVLDNYIAAQCNSSQWISEQLIHILPPILPHCQRPLISSQQISLSLKIPYGRVPTSKSIRVSHCPHRRLCAGSCQIIHAGKPKSRTLIETSILNKALVLICEPFSEVRSLLFSLLGITLLEAVTVRPSILPLYSTLEIRDLRMLPDFQQLPLSSCNVGI